MSLDCAQARNLLRDGALPGAGLDRVPQLGFHLASCAACRELYVSQPVQQPPPLVAPTIVSGRPQAAATEQPRAQLSRSRLVLAGCVLLALVAGWYLVLPLTRAWRNLGLMSTPSDSPAAAVVTGSTDVSDNIAPGLMTASTPGSPVPATSSVTPSASPTLTRLPTRTPSASPTSTATPFPTVTQTSTATPVPTIMPTVTQTASPTAIPPTPAAPTAVPRPTALVEIASAPVDGSAVNILLLGIDARPGEGWLARSDANIVIRLDPSSGRAAMLSLPRDLWVAIPGIGEGKLNSAYLLGERKGRGAAVAKATVGQALGITIHHAVVIDFAGFRSLIDALGGVPVDVPRELYDPKFPTEDYGYTVAHFTPGTEVMNGERALMFSRIRHPDSDFQRIRRQQLVLLGIARKLRERGVLQNLHEADRITAALVPFVRGDVSQPLALKLLWAMRSVNPNEVRRLTADGSMVGEANIGGAYALVANESVLHNLGVQLTGAQ